MSHYAIEFTLVNELAHLPVRLGPVMEIRRDYEKIGEASCTFTLLDVLGEIYWEISFWGSPEMRDQQREELEESVREIEEGRADLVPFEPPEDLVN